jgi:hypothetical protein
MSHKYIKLFESVEDIKDKNILDNLIILAETGILDITDTYFTDVGPRNEGYEIYLVTDDGAVGFHWDSEESTEYTGDSWWDMLIYYTRTIGDTRYSLIMRGSGKGHGDEVELEETESVLRLYSKPATEKARF